MKRLRADFGKMKLAIFPHMNNSNKNANKMNLQKLRTLATEY